MPSGARLPRGRNRKPGTLFLFVDDVSILSSLSRAVFASTALAARGATASRRTDRADPMPAPRWAASAEAHPRWVCPLACCEPAALARPLQQPALIHSCEALLRGRIASLSAGVFGHSSMALGTPGVAGLGGGLFAGYANLAAAGAPGGQGGPMQGGQDGLPANALNTLRMMLQASTMAHLQFCMSDCEDPSGHLC